METFIECNRHAFTRYRIKLEPGYTVQDVIRLLQDGWATFYYVGPESFFVDAPAEERKKTICIKYTEGDNLGRANPTKPIATISGTAGISSGDIWRRGVALSLTDPIGWDYT